MATAHKDLGPLSAGGSSFEQIPQKLRPKLFLNVIRQYWAMDQYEVRWSRTERSSVPRGFRKELGAGEYISIRRHPMPWMDIKGQQRLFGSIHNN